MKRRESSNRETWLVCRNRFSEAVRWDSTQALALSVADWGLGSGAADEFRASVSVDNFVVVSGRGQIVLECRPIGAVFRLYSSGETVRLVLVDSDQVVPEFERLVELLRQNSARVLEGAGAESDDIR